MAVNDWRTALAKFLDALTELVQEAKKKIMEEKSRH
jgi:hypothetical protein